MSHLSGSKTTKTKHWFVHHSRSELSLARCEYGFHVRFISKTLRKHNSVLVFMDRFSKMAYFFSCSRTADASRVAKIFFDGVVKLHGLSKDHVSDRDVKFTSYFWKILWHMLGTKLKFSTAFHPQTDGQTEVVKKSLGNLLHTSVGEHTRSWDLKLATAEFAYNTV